MIARLSIALFIFLVTYGAIYWLLWIGQCLRNAGGSI